MPIDLSFEEIEELAAPMLGAFVKDIENQEYCNFDTTIGGINYKLHWNKDPKDNLFHLTSAQKL